ncbi:MAG: 23S rRNA (uracil-5-)-methyltransferase RumA, partial [Lactobacillus iners]|nr:23S rRNA (uracil-5-)-methyltransferase RumA [Lactobacillus iners]
MPQWANEGLKTDVIFVDPPRKGLTDTFIKAAVATSPKKIVYISCNPATMIRDLQIFQAAGYDFDCIDPVDMFPQTPHVETIALLTRK